MFLFGANLPELAQVRFALRNVFGVGSFKAGRICDQVGLYPKCRVQDLSEAQISEIGRLIEADPDKCGHELQRRIAQRILHYHNIRSWRGDRYARGLPAHNQNSVTNARTAHKRLGLFVHLQPHAIKQTASQYAKK